MPDHPDADVRAAARRMLTAKLQDGGPKSEDVELVAGAVERLVEQNRIAEDTLEHIVQIADRGATASLIGVYAYDALIQMSVVEDTDDGR
jgi:hypothetical protein